MGRLTTSSPLKPGGFNPRGPAIHHVAGLFLLLMVLIYWRTLYAGFYFDDQSTILLNSHVTHLWQAVRDALFTDRGLVTLSFAINYALGGVEPWGYHLVNLIIHFANGLLLYGLLRRVLLLERVGYSPPRAGYLTLAGATLWLIHPLGSQAVIYATQRAELMASGMYLACGYTLVRSVQSPTHRRQWQWLCVLCGLLGMQCKLIMFTAPLALLVMDRLLIAGAYREIWQQRRWLHVGMFASWGMLLLTGTLSLLVADAQPASAGAGLTRIISPTIYLASQSGVILYYLKLSVWPAVLIFDHNWPVPVQISEYAITLAVMIGLFLLTVGLMIRGVRWSVLPVCFFLILAPTSSILPVMDLAVEHRMYLPLACVCVGVVLLLERLLRTHGKVLAGVLMVMVLLLSLRTWVRVLDYQDAVTLWRSVLVHVPDSARAQFSLNTALVLEQGLGTEIHALQQTLYKDPSNAAAWHRLGEINLQLQELEQARDPLQKACELEPGNITYQMSLARLQRILGQRHEAQTRYEHVLEQDPDNLIAITALAEILASDKQWDAALSLLQRAAALQPDDANLLLNRANVLLRAGRAAEALEPAQKAYGVSGQSLASASVLASAYAANGQWASARNLFEKCNQLKPNDPATLQRLAWLYATCPDAAVRDGEKAMQFARAFFDRIGGSSPTSWDTLAAAAAREGNYEQAIDAMHQAIARLNDLGRSDLVNSYQQRLDLYEQQKPYEQASIPTASVQTDQ